MRVFNSLIPGNGKYYCQNTIFKCILIIDINNIYTVNTYKCNSRNVVLLLGSPHLLRERLGAVKVLIQLMFTKIYDTIWFHMASQSEHINAGKADSRFAPSQWKTSLQSNAVSHWLSTNLESTLKVDTW